VTTDVDVLPLFHRALTRFGGLVHEIPGDGWSGPTPCTEWDVRTLVNHLAGEIRWMVPLFDGVSVADVGDSLNGDLLGDDPPGAWDRAVDAVVATVDAPAAMARTIRLSRRELTGADYAWEVFTDLAIHGWDLARAIGGNETIDADIVEVVEERLGPTFAEMKASGAFGPEVTPPEGADAQTRLLAMLGRVA
jgi:uncharacterized protein (TIGR03086 family)